MKKFTDIQDNTKKGVETSKDKKDFIKNLIDETLSVKDGEIKGKDKLVKTLNKVLTVAESKSIILTLETVKVKSFRHLDMNWLNESIESEKEKMMKPIDDECDECEETQDEECQNCEECECDTTSNCEGCEESTIDESNEITVNEGHLTRREDKISFILGKLKDEEFDGDIMKLIMELPDYVVSGDKTSESDVEEMLSNASDKEIDTIYKASEKK